MSPNEDFDRVGELLGDVCEAAGSPTGREVQRRVDRDGEARASAGVAPSSGVAPVSATDLSRSVALIWPKVAGDEVAANASPVRLKDGRLTVSTSSSVWAHTLQYMEAELVERLNAELGYEVLDQIVFRHAGWEENSRHDVGRDRGELSSARQVGTSGLSADEEAALADVENLDLPAEIREKVARAMRASFVRAQRDSVR